MSFSRFAIGFSRHRKVARLSDAAFRLWASAIDYAREQLTAGEIEALDIDALPHAPTGKKRDDLVSELVKVGLWEKTATGTWAIHDFEDWQDSPERVKEKRAAARERMRRVRDTRSPSVRANEERTSREVLSTGSSPEVTLTNSFTPDHGSPDLGSSSFQLSSGSSRSPARGGAKKAAKSAHVPAELAADWAPESRQLGALAQKYEVSPARILAQVPEFIWYWTQGGGGGRRKTGRGWAQAFGNQIESAAKRQALYLTQPGGPKPAGAPPRPPTALQKRLAAEEAAEIAELNARGKAALGEAPSGVHPTAVKDLLEGIG